MEPDSNPTPTLADFERAPGFFVQRTLTDRMNFVVGEARGAPSLYGKVYEPLPLVARLRGRSSARRGVREGEILRALAAAAVPVPLLVASGSEPDGRSFVVTRAVAGAPLDDVLREGRLSVPERRRDVLRRLARLVRRLHAAGFVHRDLYLCHVLLSDDASELTLIDVERALPRRRTRWRVKDLAALLSSAPNGSASRTDALLFLREYLGGRGGLRRWAIRIARKAARIRAHVPRRRDSIPRAALGGA